MTNEITFTELSFKAEGDTRIISVVVRSSLRDGQDAVYFRLTPAKHNPSNDCVAYVLSTLCGKTYQKINFDFSLGAAVVENIEKFTGAVISAPRAEIGINGDKNSGGDFAILNFSGGFDSLAAKVLLPPCGQLVSVDFGGAFTRESVFFRQYNPWICETNFRQLKYDRETWTFMGAGALLFASQASFQYNIFGAILEATPMQLRPNPVAARNTQIPPFCFMGMKNVCLTNGITEVGTCMLVTKYYPNEINRSLTSLAAPGSEKQFRKVMLTKAVLGRYPRTCEPLADFERPNPRVAVSFGKYFALDFLAIYELKHCRREDVELTVKDIPEEVTLLVNESRLTFYERLNTNFVGTIPESWRAEYFNRLLHAGIVPYDEIDWDEFAKVRDLLSKYHVALRD